METYIITVNGTSYEVQVEKKSEAAAAAPAAPAAKPAAAPKAAAKPAAKKAAGGAGAVAIKAGAAGKVVKVVSEAGKAVKAGDAVVIIEAMKMEIPVVAPQDGTVRSIDVAAGQAIESGAVVATMD